MIQKPTPRLKERHPINSRPHSRPHSLPPTLRFQVYKRDQYLCQWCKVPGGRLDPHHILPRGRGGKDELDNLASLHRLCHSFIHEHPLEGKEAGLLR